MADEAQGGLKDRDMQKYYEALIEMFTTPGWEYLTQDLQRLYDAAHTLEGVETMELLHFRRGQIDILKMIAAQPAVIRAAYDMLLEEENEPKVV